MTLPVAILAGGLATRLKPITATIPKALVEVAGKPFIVQQLAMLREQGYRRVVLCIAHLAEMVEEVVGDGSKYGMDVAYAHDGGTLLGTGGAVIKALPLLGDQFLTLYGDSYLTCDYQAIERAFLASGKQGLMTVYSNNGQYDASNVLFQEGRIVRYDKVDTAGMNHIDYGLGGFHAAAFADFPANTKLDLATVYQRLLARNELFGAEVTERFYEIGSHAGLEETRHLLAAKGST